MADLTTNDFYSMDGQAAGSGFVDPRKELQALKNKIAASAVENVAIPNDQSLSPENIVNRLAMDVASQTPEVLAQQYNNSRENQIINNSGLGNAMPIVSSSDNNKSNDYFGLLRKKESTNNYQAENDLGYLGGYQMGASALIEAGLVKPGTKSNKALNDPKNWIGGLDKNKFLNTPKLQDSAVRKYTAKNKKYLGDLYKNASPEEKAGLLGSAHLIGAGATKRDMNQVDANGVSGNDRYKTFYGLMGY